MRLHGNCGNPNEAADIEYVRNHLSIESFHGFSDSDFQEFMALIETARFTDTEHHTEFPDFISKNGFIEHFGVTSGAENDNAGAQNAMQRRQRMPDVRLKRDFAEKLAEIAQLSKKQRRKIQRAISQHKVLLYFERNDESKDLFLASFKRNWESHMVSLRCCGMKGRSCFFVSSDDILTASEMLKEEKTVNGETVFFGDLGEREIPFGLYCMPELLRYIYEFVNEVDYVIYLNRRTKYIDCIKTASIPMILDILSVKEYVVTAQTVFELIER